MTLNNTPILLKTDRSRQLDKFFTNTETSKLVTGLFFSYFKRSFPNKRKFFIEPSAGSGSFLKFLPNDTCAIDLEPPQQIGTNFTIKKQDFFTFSQNDINPKNLTKIIITIGNPPFGKNSSLAVKFFNHAAQFSDVIAFILPRTFQKDSVQHRLSNNFHLKEEYVLGENNFTLDGKSYNVPCVFQIWEKSEVLRQSIKKEICHNDFTYTKKELADFAMQRVGVNAGSIKDIQNFQNSASSHYFIKSNVSKKQLMKIFKKIDWASIKHNTAGNPSISKTEVFQKYSEYKNEYENK